MPFDCSSSCSLLFYYFLSKYIKWSELGSDDQVYSCSKSADCENLPQDNVGVQDSDLALNRTGTLETGNGAQISSVGHVYEYMLKRRKLLVCIWKNSQIA